MNNKSTDIKSLAESVANSVDFTEFPHVLAVVGIFAVGKTTTISKIAAQIKTNEKTAKIRLVSLDSQRMGALAQISQFSRVIDAESTFIGDSLELWNLLREREPNEYILIDTPGCGLNDDTDINNLKGFLTDEKIPVDVFLVIDCPSACAINESVLSKFESLNYKGIILTKCDMSLNLKETLTTIAKLNKKVSFFSAGFKLINFLKPATIENTLNLLEGGR